MRKNQLPLYCLRKLCPSKQTGNQHLSPCNNFSNYILSRLMFKYSFVLNPKHTEGGGKFAPLILFVHSSWKFFLTTYDKTLCKFLFCTYEDSHNLIWSKKLSKGHVEDINVAWLENCKNKNCNFRVLRVILKGFFIK